MKKFLPLLLLFLPLFAAAQIDPIPPKKAKKIFVSNSDSPTVAIKKIAVKLFERGYTIESKDETLGYISTNEKSHEKFATSMKARAVVKDSVIIVTGVMSLELEFTLGGVKSVRSFNDIYYGGSKRSPLRSSWNELESIAKEIGTIIKYE